MIVVHTASTYGQIIRSGPFMDDLTDPPTLRDMTFFTVTATFYPPDAAAFTRAGVGTDAGYIQYQLGSADIPESTPTGRPTRWRVLLTAEDVDENLPGELHTLLVIQPGEVYDPSSGRCG